MTQPEKPAAPADPSPPPGGIHEMLGEDWVFDPAVAVPMMSAWGHAGFIGLQYRAHGADWLEIGLPWREDLVGDPASGVLASGPIISLIDTATSLAVWTRKGRFEAQATLDLRVDYLRAATPGKTVVGRGECYAIRRSMAFVRAIAHDGDASDPVAHATGIFMLTNQ